MMTPSLPKVEDHVSAWCNGFSSAAMMNVKKLFHDLGFQTTEQRATFVTFMLGNSDKCAPFYYQKWPKKGKPCIRSHNLFFSFTYDSDQGIFLSDVVSATLSTHFSSISSLQPLDHSSANLVRALVLSLQAVCISYLCSLHAQQQP